MSNDKIKKNYFFLNSKEKNPESTQVHFTNPLHVKWDWKTLKLKKIEKKTKVKSIKKNTEKMSLPRLTWLTRIRDNPT
jgi:hypothetical protein